MKISTKGHYAVQALVDIASQTDEAPISLSVVATRQDLSQNYLEQLFDGRGSSIDSSTTSARVT